MTGNDFNAPGAADISTDDDETGALQNLLDLLDENPSQDASAD
tara:strand:- start:752 stop:880 length:129 start_codon:yes stop_codon:yes gene_type:complete